MALTCPRGRNGNPSTKVCCIEPVVKQYLNLDLGDLLSLSLGPDQENTQHTAFDHLDQNHKVLEMSQERMFSTDFQTLGTSS